MSPDENSKETGTSLSAPASTNYTAFSRKQKKGFSCPDYGWHWQCQGCSFYGMPSSNKSWYPTPISWASPWVTVARTSAPTGAGVAARRGAVIVLHTASAASSREVTCPATVISIQKCSSFESCVLNLLSIQCPWLAKKTHRIPPHAHSLG